MRDLERVNRGELTSTFENSVTSGGSTDKTICLDRRMFPCLNRSMLATLQIVQSPEKAGVLLQPGRLRLLEQLTEPDSAAGLARRLGVPRQKLNYHLRELEREGFLELIEERRKGNCMERVVRAVAREFLIAPQTGDRVTADRLSAAYLASTAARMIRELASLCIRARRAGKRVATLTLETEIRFASAESRAAFAKEMTASIAHLAAKYHNERAEGGRRFRLLSAVYPAVKLEECATESANLE
jgi:DNA-binding transcriptional ArsR family regulator